MDAGHTDTTVLKKVLTECVGKKCRDPKRSENIDDYKYMAEAWGR